MTRFGLTSMPFAAFFLLAMCSGMNLHAETFQSSGQDLMYVQAIEIDQSGKSLTLLAAIGKDVGSSENNRLTIVNVDVSGGRIAKEILLDRSFEMLPPVSIYSDVESNQFLVGYTSQLGPVIRKFSANGIQLDEQVVQFDSNGIFGITRLGGNLHVITENGIHLLAEDGSSRLVFSVSADEYIASYSRTDSDDCGFVAAIVDGRRMNWELQVLCSNDGLLTVKHAIQGVATIAPDVDIKILRVAADRRTIWVAGGSGDAHVAFVVCTVGPKPKCETSPLELTQYAQPLVAMQSPIAMISDDIIAVADASNEMMALTLYRLDGRKVDERNLDLTDVTNKDKLAVGVAGMAVEVSNNQLWVLAQSVAIMTEDPEKFVEEGTLVELGFAAFYLDQESDALLPLRHSE